MNLYAWLRFLHILGLAVFLFAHGVSGGAAFALRGPVSGYSRTLLRLSQRSSFVSNPGIVLVLAYFLLLPPLLAMTIMRSYFIKMGFIRFFVLVTLIQFMAALPIKMVLRWTLNLKYIVFIPEAFFNI